MLKNSSFVLNVSHSRWRRAEPAAYCKAAMLVKPTRKVAAVPTFTSGDVESSQGNLSEAVEQPGKTANMATAQQVRQSDEGVDELLPLHTKHDVNCVRQ